MALCLKDIRKSKSLSQVEVAALAGISQPAYSNIENRKRKPSTDTLLRLADILGITTDELLGREPTKEEAS